MPSYEYNEIKSKIKAYRSKAEPEQSIAHSNGRSKEFSEIRDKIKSGGFTTSMSAEDVDTFLHDSRSFMEQSVKEYEALTWSTATSKEYQDKRNAASQDLTSRASQVRTYLNANKSSIDPETYETYMSCLDDFSKYQAQSATNFEKAYSGYGDFENEEQYNQYLQDYNQRSAWEQKYSGMTYSQLQDALSSLEAGAEKDWLDEYASSIMTLQDAETEVKKVDWKIQRQSALLKHYEDLTRIEQPAAGRAEIEKIASIYGSTTDLENEITEQKNKKYRLENAIRYNYLSDNEDFEELSKAQDFDSLIYRIVNNPDLAASLDKNSFIELFGNNNMVGTADAIYDVLTPDNIQRMRNEERGIFNYIYAKEGEYAAKKYLEYLQYSLDKRASDDFMKWVSDATQSVPVLSQTAASLLSTPLNLLGGVGLVDAAGQKLVNSITGEYKPVNYNRRSMYFSRAASTIRGTVAQNIADATGVIDLDEEKHPYLSRVLNGKGLADVYQLGMSMQDSAAIVGLSAINPALGTVGTALLGGSAGTQTMLDAVERGATDEQALSLGILSGAFEMLFEKYELGSLMKADDVMWKNIINQAITEGFGEGATEISNMAADYLIMAKNSNYERNIRQYMEDHPDWSYEEAEKQALIDSALQIAEASGGGIISGGIMSFGMTAINSGMAKYQQITDMRDAAVDEFYANKYREDIPGLVRSVLAMDPENQMARAVLKKLGNKETVTNHEIRQLAEPVVAAEMRKTASARLQELGETGDLAALSQAAAKFATGQKLTAEEKAALKDSDYGSQVATELSQSLKEEGKQARKWGKETTKDRMKQMKSLEKALIKRNKAVQRGEIAPDTERQDDIDLDEAPEETFKVADDGATYQNSTRKAIKIKDVTFKNGVLTLRTEDGSEIAAYDVTYGTEAEAMVYEAVAQLAGIIDGKTATRLSARLIHQINEGDAVSDQYIKAVAEAYRFGYEGRGLEAARAKSSITSKLTDRQRNYAYKMGEKYAMETKSTRQDNVTKGVDNSTQTTKGRKKSDKRKKSPDGKSYDNVQFESKVKKWGEKQRADVEFLNFVARDIACGVTVHVFESFEGGDGKRYYYDSNGKLQRAPNGKYIQANGDIYLDLNAGDSGEGLVLNTFAHELYHHIEKWSPAKARQLAEFLVKEQGLDSVGAMVEAQIEKAEAAGHGVKYFMKQGMSRTAAENTVRARAFSDFVADSLETVFTKGDGLETLQRLKKTDQGLFDRLKSFVDRWVSKLKKYYQGDHTISIEGQAAAQLETFQQIQELFMEALVDAGENFRNREVLRADTDVDAEKNTADGGEMYSIRNDVVDTNGVEYDHVVELDYKIFNRVRRSGKAYIDFIRNKLIKQKITLFDDNGISEVIEFAGEKERVLKDGAKNKHLVIGELTQARNEIKKLVIVNAVETAEISRMAGTSNEHSHQWLDENGWEERTSYVMTKDGTIYPVTLHIARARDGRNILYDVNIKINEGIAADKIATSLRAKKQAEQAVRTTKPSREKITQSDLEVKKNSNETESFSDRNVTPTSNREILLRATEDATRTDWEKKLLQRYKDKSKEIADTEEMLNHTKQLIKELSSDVKYKSKVMSLRSDKISMESQLRKLNSELRNMMELKPLQDVLKREKQSVLRTAEQRYKNRLYEQKLSAEVKQSELLREHRETKAALRQQQSDYAIMEDEFIRIVKSYEKLEKTAEKSAAKAAQLPDLKQTLKEEAQKHRADNKTWDAEFRRLLREYEKSGRKINDLEQKIADQRKAAKDKVESRKRTEMRHQIRRDVKDIYKLYNRGKDANNVKEEMKEFVSHALSSAELLLDDLYTDDDMIRNGMGINLSPHEKALLDKAKKILYRLDNPPTASSVAMLEEWERREQKLKVELSKTKTELQEAFLQARRQQKGDILSMVMQDLCDAYEELGNSKKPYIRTAFRPFVLMHLEGVRSNLKETRVEDMTLEQMTELHEAYTMVLTSIRDANKAFCANRSIDYMAKQLISEFSGERLSKSAVKNIARNISESVGWDYEKLYYALERINSPTFTQLFVNLANAEDIIMEDVEDAKAHRRKTVEKYGFKKWSINKKVDQEFVDNLGHSFQLTLGEIMLLYAYTRRGNVWRQLEVGGFVLERKGLSDDRNATAYKLTPAQCLSITNTLTAEQKHFVEDMQKYLSDVMGAKGNEVSMKLYGVNLYNDPNYCPIHIAGEYKARAAEATAKKQAGFESLAHTGFTKTKNIDATATISLESFMDIWVDHVNEMSRYHGAVPALEDIRRVMNYSDHSDSQKDSVSVSAMMENKFGKQAVQYFENLYREVNSGAVLDKLQSLSLPQKALRKSRKQAVAYSLSVIIQQQSSICRAFAMVDPKYFAGMSGAGAASWGTAKTVANLWNKKQTAAYAEMVKYAPGVTLAKEIGGFDASGGGIRNYLMDDEKNVFQSMKTGTTGEKLQAVGKLVDDNPIANLPNLADKIAWIEIWNACKRETKDKYRSMDPKSEAFMKRVGQRFTEVIRATQVYDSVFAKSPLLKSKNLAVQYMVGFMNESNVVANMTESAIRDIRKGGAENIKKGARKLFAVTRSIIFCNILKSLVYAMRDDDEEETYIEKYMQALTGNMIADFTPVNYIPFARDIWSLVKGYDVERPDIAIYSDLIYSIKKYYKVSNKDVSDMYPDEQEKWESQYTEAGWGLIGAIAGCVGIPIKNIYREIDSAFNFIRTCGESAGKTTWRTYGDACYQGIVEELPWLQSESKSDQIYEAVAEVDTKYLKRLQAGYLDSDGKLKTSYYTALRKGLRENDPRIKKAAQARLSGDHTTANKLLNQIVAEGRFTRSDIDAAIKEEYNQLKDD